MKSVFRLWILNFAASLELPDWCQDKREDCHRYIGRGPLGGGCERHAEYMRMFCARTCHFCDEPEDALQTAQIQIADSQIHLLTARGVRRWHFMELPVKGPVDSCPVGESNEAQRNTSCSIYSWRTHLASARFYDSLSHNLNSSVYRWDPLASRFERHQALPTSGAWALSSFKLAGQYYLALASFFDGFSRQLSSPIYRWDVLTDAFVWHQDLQTEGAKDVEFLLLSDSSGVLAFAETNANDNAGTCRLFHWAHRLRAFEPLQVLPTAGAYDVETFMPSTGEKAIVVVHEDGAEVYGTRWQDGELAGFSLLQELKIGHGRDAEHFQWAGRDLLALSVFRSEQSYEVETLVYEWDASSRTLIEVQGLQSAGAFDAEYLEFREPMLLVANQRLGVSRMYSFNSTSCDQLLCPLAEFKTPGVYNVAYNVSEDTFL